VKGEQIALFNVDSQFFALDNTCTHRGGPLADGEVSGHEVTCPGTAPHSTFGRAKS
jgi:nitrite reductase/ring-hydroxylating ferredoxin subunit